jgi:hypothetical protein
LCAQKSFGRIIFKSQKLEIPAQQPLLLQSQKAQSGTDKPLARQHIGGETPKSAMIYPLVTEPKLDPKQTVPTTNKAALDLSLKAFFGFQKTAQSGVYNPPMRHHQACAISYWGAANQYPITHGLQTDLQYSDRRAPHHHKADQLRSSVQDR